MKRHNRLGLKEKFSFLAIMTYNREIEKNVLLKKKKNYKKQESRGMLNEMEYTRTRY